MTFNVIRENKILVKISEFTVCKKAKDKDNGQHAPLCKLFSGFVTCSQELLVFIAYRNNNSNYC